MYYRLKADHTTEKVELGEVVAHAALWQENVGNYLVSTIFLSLDHNFSDEGKPILFETMVFAKGGVEMYIDRYRTYDEAEKGHQRAVYLTQESVRTGMEDFYALDFELKGCIEPT